MRKVRESARLVVGSTDEWQARYGTTGRVIRGKYNVKKLLQRWNVFSNLYISPLGSEKFAPAITWPEAREIIYKSYTRRCQLSIILLGIATFLLYLGGMVLEKPHATHIGFASTGLLLFLIVDYFVNASSSEGLARRSTFYLFVRENTHADAILWSSVMVVAGLLQVWLQKMAGGFDALILKYGLSYEALGGGEWWRLLTGPFFHVDSFHWGVNLASLLLIVGIGGLVSRRFTVCTFLISSAVGGFMGWVLSAYTHHDAYAGVSGGIFGIYGMCTNVALFHRSIFPNKMALTIVGFSILNISASAFISQNSSIEGHIAGFAAGFLVGGFFVRRLPKASEGSVISSSSIHL